MSSIKTSVKIFKQYFKYSPLPNVTGSGKAKIIWDWAHSQRQTSKSAKTEINSFWGG